MPRSSLGSTLFILLLNLSLALPSLWAQTLTFKKSGKAVRTFTLEELKARLPSSAMKVIEPHNGKEVTYTAFSFNGLLSLKEVYGQEWQKEEEVLFTCEDGYQPSVPVKDFTTHQSYLAFKLEDGRPFVVNNKGQNEKDVALGPFYLVWDNVHHKELLEEGASSWPYQLVGVDLVKFGDHFAHLAPPKGAPPGAVEGFLAFRKYCLKCHSVAGEGGNKGPDLEGVTGSYSKEWLQKFISHPRQVRPESHMAELNLNLPDREKVIAKIIGYLGTKLKSKAKIKTGK